MAVVVVVAVAVAVVAPTVVVFEAEAAAGAAVPAVVPADVADVAGVAVADVVVAACAGSVTHRARGECWVQQVSKVLMAVEAAAAVAGEEGETAWLGMMSCAGGRTVAADLVHDSVARFVEMSAKMAGES